MSGKTDKKIRQVARKMTRGDYEAFIKSIPQMPLHFKKAMMINQTKGVNLWQRIVCAWAIVRQK